MNPLQPKQYLKIIFFLSLLGVIVSAYLTYIHYSHLTTPCDFNSSFSCSSVNRSSYAELGGVPVALLGIGVYTILGLLSLGLYYKWAEKLDWKIAQKLISSPVLLGISLLALSFSLYLTYVEFFIIQSICILCLFSQTLIIGITLSSDQYQRLENLKIETEKKQTEVLAL